MEWLVNNWSILVAGIVVITVGSITVYKWAMKPTDEQIKNIKEWLLYAVTQAEKELGSGTGQLKLRYVYDWACERFKWVSLVPFATFEEWVDEALEQMRKMLDENEQVKAIVEGE